MPVSPQRQRQLRLIRKRQGMQPMACRHSYQPGYDIDACSIEGLRISQ
jgi:hypothetical protein